MRPSIQRISRSHHDHDSPRRARRGALHRPTAPRWPPTTRRSTSSTACRWTRSRCCSRRWTRDPDFVSGHLLMAGFMLSAIDAPAAAGMAQGQPGRRGRQPRSGANAREQSLLAALRAWADGDMRRANRLLGPPPDRPSARPVRAAARAHGRPGAGPVAHAARPHRPRARPAGAPTTRATATCWACTPSAWRSATSTRAPRRWACSALELQPHDAWAVHAVAHVYEMQGRVADGIRWLQPTQRALAAGQRAGGAQPLAPGADAPGRRRHRRRRWRSTTARSRRRPKPMALDLVDASALLWRLGLRGVDVGDALAGAGRALARSRPPGAGRLQRRACDAGAGRGRRRSAARRGPAAIADAAARRRRARRGARSRCRAVRGDAGLRRRPLRALRRAAAAAAAGQPGLGGSHAQRSLLHLTAIEAARAPATGRWRARSATNGRRASRICCILRECWNAWPRERGRAAVDRQVNPGRERGAERG